jgi:cysteine desulfurase
MRHVYLDHTATTPLDPLVLEAMEPFFHETFGNASSIHRFGRESRAALDESRDTLARFLGARASELFFLSGGTEADNAALKGAMWELKKSGKNHIVTDVTEHHAVLETCAYLEGEGFEVTYVPCNSSGMISPDDVRAAIKTTTGIVSVMHANNETGTINPIKEIGEICREKGVLFHSDVVQSFGKLPLNVSEIPVDMLSLSAHKIYGPKGIGAMYIRKGVKIERLMHGGGQERGRRAGTENVAAAVGFARAAELMFESYRNENARLLALKEEMRKMLAEKFPSLIFNGHASKALSHILNVSFDSSKIAVDGEALLFNLDLAGIAVTSGSACTSGSIEPSHVLLAMGRDAAAAKATIRFSMGRSTTREDLIYTVEKLEEVVGRIGKKF